MATYIILNLFFICLVAAIVLLSRFTVPLRKFTVLLPCMIALTAVFDSLIIARGIVAYDASKILNIYIGKTPVEDFAYAIVAIIVTPFLWERFGKNAK